MIKKTIVKNWKTIFNSQVIIFIAFNILAFIYYWDKPAHQYFNRGIEEINLQSVFSLIMTYLFVIFIVIVFIYPIIYGIQILSLKVDKEIFKKNKSKNIILLVLYILAIVSVFSLLMINNSHSIKAMN
ncbi:hypothetical protein NAL32_21515 [Chryseobacterium sp. Ch-15]|uniref:Uncharacterized protein n=1 Tax=Chryseobacterium muglaense TaxID=2893752 RepID=A0A9Q3UYV7_9FLAO|nr:hypothetical protein [Chryseobacterium muglaense]MBD3907302.1 hypothetical protein [Chryseobacterium muglaense]MCC9036513.1 hypothetical protein [Chryseobacterium muglaense]MCM2556971.1 hypothetical protein [Chryseobacterium muglaense]